MSPSLSSSIDSSPIFIVGCDRSGTTLLRLMLSQSRSLHVLHETGFVPHLLENAEEYGSFESARERWCFLRDVQTFPATTETTGWSSFPFDVETAERKIKHVAPITYAEACRLLYEMAAEEEGAERWGDKTPAYTNHILQLADLFPDARFVHIIRDGRDVARSLVEAGWHATIREAAQRWRSSVNMARQTGMSLETSRYMEVSFEALVRNPAKTLQTLCSKINLAESRAMLTFYGSAEKNLPDVHGELYAKTAGPVDPSRASAWREEATRTEIADVESVAGDLLEVLDYEVTGARLPVHVQLTRRAIRFARPIARRFI